MTHSLELDIIARAVGTIQAMQLRAKLDETGDDGKGFASLASVLKALRPQWDEAGLTVIQFSGVSDVTTTIVHPHSGQFLSERTTCEMRADGARAYGPRHVLMQLFGVTEQKEKTPKKKTGFTSVRTPNGHPYHVSERVVEAFRANRLNDGQMGLILSRDITEDEMIAEAQRLGGKK